MPKFLFEAPKNICRYDLLPTETSVATICYQRKKQKSFFLWHTICKSKSKRNQIKK